MTRPFVTIVVAVRNGERYLAEALASIAAQGYRAYEVVVVDGRSTDRTRQIATATGARIVDQPGTGIGDAYNTGIAAAQGELVAFLSHDDRWTPDKLSVQVGLLAEHPELQFTVAHVRFFLEPGCPRPAGFRPELLTGEHVGRIMETLLARRQVFDLVGPFDVELPFGEDVDWFARAADLGVRMAVVPRVLLEKRVHGSNTSSDAARSWPLLLDVLRRAVARKRRPATCATASPSLPPISKG